MVSDNGRGDGQATDGDLPIYVDAASMHLFYEPAWVLRLTIAGNRSYPNVKVVRAAPLTQPDAYISFLDGDDEEICMLEDLTQLDAASRAIVDDELSRRYLTSIVLNINSARNEFGTSYWEVETDRGRREFVVQNVAENARWFGGKRLLITDVDGNRFEIPNLDRLDRASQVLVAQIL